MVAGPFGVPTPSVALLVWLATQEYPGQSIVTGPTLSSICLMIKEMSVGYVRSTALLPTPWTLSSSLSEPASRIPPIWPSKSNMTDPESPFRQKAEPYSRLIIGATRMSLSVPVRRTLLISLPTPYVRPDDFPCFPTTRPSPSEKVPFSRRGPLGGIV